MAVAEDHDTALRAEEWLFHFMRGNVKAAVAVEAGGPPIRPSAVVAAVVSLLADQRLVLMPTRVEDESDNPEGD
ncbi:hypothetical protein NWT09_22120 [Mycolicibacterium sp. jd]|uniref:hypothetical protein n=1 Tax=unclassified Mycolicibacterium TaxID=2636767 RepID=UPI00351B971E